MAERKYEYRGPRGVEEHVEAIYEQLSASPSDRHDTLKDHVATLIQQSKSVQQARAREAENESSDVALALSLLVALTLAFLLLGYFGSGDWEWLNDQRFAIRHWGIVCAAVYVGISIERSSFFKRLWAFHFTKLVSTVALSGLIVFSSGKASGLINSVFAVDASALPFTRAIVTGLLVFQYAYPLLLVVGLFAAAHAFRVLGWAKNKIWPSDGYESPPLNSIVFTLLGLAVLGFSSHWVNNDFSAGAWSAKIYRLAHILDFNTRHSCANLRPGSSVIFLGNNQTRVLVDAGTAQTNDMESFVDAQRSQRIQIPTGFAILPCEQTAQ